MNAGATLPTASALSGKRLVVVRGSVTGGTAWDFSRLGQVSMVGQGSGATVKGSAVSNALVGIGGELFIRNVTFSGASGGNGISVGAGKLALDHVTTTGNQIGL